MNEMQGWSDIKSAMAAVPEGAGFQAPIPENWRQGRTAYGGLSTALMYMAAQETIKDLPPLRSALINFVGPVTEDPILNAQLERRGRNVVNVSADAKVGEHAVARAEFLFGAARASKVNVACPAPEGPTPENCEPFTPEFARPMVPAFFHNFDTRLVAGGRPMTGAKDGLIRAWSRHQDPKARRGTDALLCLADVLPPAALPMLRSLAPVSSMSWIINLLTDTPETEDGWWLVESRLTAARGGYASQVMRMWNTAGELVIEGLQSVAIFDA